VNHRVMELGTTLARDNELLQQLLPELLAEESGRQFLLGQGLGKGTADLQRQWKLLYDAFTGAPGNPNVSVLAGFVQGARTQNPATAASILDSVVGDAKLDVHYPALLGVPRDDSDGDRLIAAMKRAVSRPHRYLLRTSQGSDGGLSVAKFCEAIEVLSQMESGLLPAIDELGAELHQWKAKKAAIPSGLVALARSLLARFTFDVGTHNVAWRVNELAKMAFAGPDAVEAATQFAARFAEALGNYRTHGDEYGDLACTLFKLQPVVALDAFLSKPTGKRHFGFRARFIARHGPVVQCAPEDVLLQWVGVAPDPRAALVAREINIMDIKTADEGGVTLSPLAARLLELAPDKASVLEAFGKHLHPTSWSGSLAQTLSPHVALLEGLSGDNDLLVGNWAKEALKVVHRRIEQDRTMDVLREQSFE
jgi:hypothetical protein